MKKLFYAFYSISLALCSLGAIADNWTVQGAWLDATPVGPEYVPNYHAQCRVGGVQAYEDLALPSPGFTAALTFDPVQVFDCRWQNSNIVVTPAVDGNWSVWVQGAVAQQPADPSGGTLILIRALP